MAQYEMSLRDHWRIIRRRRWTIIVCSLLVGLFAFWFARQREPEYQSTSAIKFEQSTSLTGLLVEVLSFSPSDTIETQAAIVRSFPVMEQVAKRLGELPTTMPPEAVKESKAYTGVVDALAARVKTSRVASTNILEITTTSSDPRKAKDLANAVAEVYRDVQSRARNARIIEARQFIEQQLKELEGRVKKAEEAMWAFREANRVIAPGAESTVLLSLFTQIRGDIEKTRQQRTELELAAGRLSRANGLTAREAERVYVDSANPAMVRLQATLADLMLERNNLALEVTDSHPRLQAVNDRIREVRGEMLRELHAQIALLRNREEILSRQIGELFQKNREVPTIELSLQRLQREAKVNDDLLALLKTRHQEALIKEAEKIEEVTIIRPAAEPSAPVGGQALYPLLLGLLTGLFLGLVLAYVQETLDTSIGTIEEVEDYLGVPVLGVIPHIDTREIMDRLVERRPALASMDPEMLSRHALLVSHFDPKSPVAEAFRSLRTRIQFATMERPGKVFLLTSPTLQEGKTTTIVNLAITLSQAGQKTLLVGANLRRPSIHKFFGIDRDPAVTDAAILGGQMDGVILVYQAGKVGRLALKRAKVQLESARATVWGVVLNDLGAEIAGYAPYHQYYTHYYGEEGAGEEGRQAPQGFVGRLLGTLRGLRSRKPPPSPEAAAPPKVAAPRPATRGRRHRQFWVGVTLLLVLVLLLAALLAWRLGLFAPTGMGPVRELFRSTLSERAAQQKSSGAPAAPPGPQAAAPGRTPVPADVRYALEFGPFASAEEAERVERQLNTAGFPTVRFRQQGGGNLYGVFLEHVPSRPEAEAIQERLKAEGYAQTVLAGSGDNLSIRVGELTPLRTAVQVAEKLRASGYQVRVAVQPGEALNLAIRHGNFASEEEAGVRSRDLSQKGLSGHRVVRVK